MLRLKEIFFQHFLGTAVLVLALTLGTSAQAVTIYKYLEHGVVKYSQTQPSSGTNYEVIQLRQPAQTSATAPPTEPTNVDAQEPAAQTASLRQQEEQVIAERCQNLRANLTSLNSGGRVFETNANGQRNYLNNREIQVRRERIEQALNQYCR